MRRRLLGLLLAAAATAALALTPQAEEFIAITAKLEPVQCEKRKLRRAIVLAGVEKRFADEKKLRARFAELDADPEIARLEKRLAVLQARVLDAQGRPRNREDLEAISLQQRKAFYECE
ncbi:MAG: hypothetical protein AB7S87_11455 [Burkholderiales bacterium]